VFGFTAMLACTDSEEMAVTPAPPAVDADVTLESLLAELVDLDALTRAPDPEYRSLQSSSYDRASRDPDEPVGWFANGDNGQFQSMRETDGRTEYVMLETAGPGALTRIWSAAPQGTLRIYIDDAPTPTIEADMTELMTGRTASFPEPFAYRAARGVNLYFPIPFATGVRVTVDRPERFYYHVGYRAYAATTRVESYTRAVHARAEAMAADVATRLSRPSRATESSHSARLEVEPGREATTRIANEGPGAIERLSVRVEPATPETLRRTRLELWFDGRPTVRGSLGDLFGTGPGMNVHESIVTAVDDDGLHLFFVMPFQREAELRVAGPVPAIVDVEASLRDYEWSERSRYFHGARRPYELIARTPQDLRLLEIEGSGHFVGGVLNVANSSRGWWGEGDEKIWVDGDAFPSFFGTGTEDYYGYAYCSTELFHRPFHGQTLAEGPDNAGRISLYRFHVLDAIPFRERFRFDLEVWYWATYAQLGYDAVVFWYAGDDARLIAPTDQVEDYVLAPVPEHDPAIADPSDLPHNPTPTVDPPFYCGRPAP
jgi:hypothetical protein